MSERTTPEAIADRLDNLGLGAQVDGDGVRAYGLPDDWRPLLEMMENPLTIDAVKGAVSDTLVAVNDTYNCWTKTERKAAQRAFELLMHRLAPSAAKQNGGQQG